MGLNDAVLALEYRSSEKESKGLLKKYVVLYVTIIHHQKFVSRIYLTLKFLHNVNNFWGKFRTEQKPVLIGRMQDLLNLTLCYVITIETGIKLADFILYVEIRE